MNPQDLAIEAHGLVKVFGENRAVDGVDLAVQAGTVYGVLGLNGAGKTTTISMLATLLKADAGEAKIFGHDVRREAQVVRQLIGVTGQYASVDENLSATENLRLFSKLLGLSGRAAKLKSAELLEEFGLTEAAKRPLKNFSGGMRRRLDLAPLGASAPQTSSISRSGPTVCPSERRPCHPDREVLPDRGAADVAVQSGRGSFLRWYRLGGCPGFVAA